MARPRPYRYIAFDALTREIVNADLPLSGVTWGPDLNGSGEVQAKIEPRLVGLDPDTQLMPVRNGLLIEREGVLRWGGILWSAKPEGETYSLTAHGWSSYPHSRFDLAGDANGAGPWTYADPLDVVRALLAYMQSLPDSFQLAVDATTSTAKVGTPDSPFSTPWWESHNIGQVIDDLSGADDGFDYGNETRWVDQTANTFEARVQLGYPRLGARRKDLRFTSGINVLRAVPIDYDGTQFAQCVTGLGAGDGRNMRRADDAIRNGMLRCEYILDEKSIADQTLLASVTRAERIARQRMGVIAEIVIDPAHPDAPLGSFTVGDDVLCDVHEPWADLTTWHRVIGYRVDVDAGDEITVSLARSDQFHYGAAA